jgi:hypothetical protein
LEGDIKEVVGALMSVLGGDEISIAEVEDLAFEATGALQVAVNEAYIKLLEFAYDRDARLKDGTLDGEMRSDLQEALNKIVRLSDNDPPRFGVRSSDSGKQFRHSLDRGSRPCQSEILGSA